MQTANFRYLNVENTWPSFTLQGLTIRADGALTLAPVPKAGTGLGDPLDLVPALEGPAGIAADRAGNVYVADPANHRILRVDGCDGSTCPLPCLTGPGDEFGQLDTPRGLVVGPRNALYIADSCNDRVQVVDLATGQIRGIWDGFDNPWDLAVDQAGFIYVADHGSGRVLKYDADGRAYPGFWETIDSGPRPPGEPSYVFLFVRQEESSERLVVLDRSVPVLLAYDLDGNYDAELSDWWQDLPLHPDGGLVISDGVLYLGDPDGDRVLTFDTEGGFIGTAAGFHGSARYLAIDRNGRLLVHPGNGGAATSLDPQGAFADSGSFVAGPIKIGTGGIEGGDPDFPRRWHRLVALADELPAGAHVRFFSHVGPAAPSNVLTLDNTADDVGPDDWQPAPRDALDLLVDDSPGSTLWIRGELRGDGTVSPTLHQLRVSYDHDGYIRRVPSIFSGERDLERMLDLMESFLGEAEATIDDLPLLFDALAAPDTGTPLSKALLGSSRELSSHGWLDWLASWLALPLSETWDDDRRRSVIASAFARYGRRGTLAALKEYVELYAGVEVEITEPGRQLAIWSLDRTSVLGFDTMLAGAEPQGAVVDVSAVADRSHLIADDEYGAPLFESTAHRFCVRTKQSNEAELERIKVVLEREKPAHTVYDLCVVDNRMRIGVQSRVGVDAYVACPPEPAVLGTSTDFLLENDPGRPARMGEDARVGRTSIRS